MAKIIIWSAGEFFYPKIPSFEGSNYCLRYSSIKSFKQVKGDWEVIIGGYESGMGAFIELSKLGKKPIVIDKELI
ncbi:MAG: NAD(P)-binding domain-containing protein [Patescibacteria group bacterium]|nr:NAD(P)-binding domain-containing protein [Patescibacteria group bacterium]